MANQLLLCLSILHLLPLQLASTRVEYSSALDHVVVEGFQDGSDIQDDESSINLSVIMTNMASEEAKAPESMLTHLDLYLSSLLNHYNKQQNSSLRLIIISDVTLVDHLRLHLKMLIGKELSRRLIQGKHLQFPRLQIHLVNIETIVAQNQDLITQMKPLFSRTEKEVYHPGDPRRAEFEKRWRNVGGRPEEFENMIIETDNELVLKYSHDLFYIAPFYHLAFPNLDHLIATDLDIEFRSNVEELYEEFQNFPEFALLGAAKDPTLRYKNEAKEYLESGQILGDGGDYVGLNTGVVLFNLTRMRRSKDYKQQLNIDAMQELVTHFRFNGKCLLGDQEWVTLLSWKMPAFFYKLPCAFNYIIGLTMEDRKEVDLGSEADCKSPKIIHRTTSLDNSISHST